MAHDPDTEYGLLPGLYLAQNDINAMRARKSFTPGTVLQSLKGETYIVTNGTIRQNIERIEK